MKKHINISVWGLVQGVWFRKSTEQQARSFGINGFVRNEPDGSVYIEAEGDADVLNEFVNWCHQGPELAKVEKVDVVTGSFTGIKGFSIKY